MPTIVVPAPPKSAFNKHRPISDLLQGQLKHFHHIELSLPPELRSNMIPRDYATEDGAARYIAHLTSALQSFGKAIPPAPIPIRRPAPKPSPSLTLALAAAADTSTAKPQSSKAKTSKNPPAKPSKIVAIAKGKKE